MGIVVKNREPCSVGAHKDASEPCHDTSRSRVAFVPAGSRNLVEKECIASGSPSKRCRNRLCNVNSVRRPSCLVSAAHYWPRKGFVMICSTMQPKGHTGGPRQRLWGRSKCSALRISVFQPVWHHHTLCRKVLRFKLNALCKRQLTRIARRHASTQHKCLSAVPRSHFSRAEVFNNPPDVLVSN